MIKLQKFSARKLDIALKSNYTSVFVALLYHASFASLIFFVKIPRSQNLTKRAAAPPHSKSREAWSIFYWIPHFFFFFFLSLIFLYISRLNYSKIACFESATGSLYFNNYFFISFLLRIKNKLRWRWPTTKSAMSRTFVTQEYTSKKVDNFLEFTY